MATITKRGDSWFAQVRRKGFAPRYKSFKRKADAQQWAREQELAVDAGSAPMSCHKPVTIEELFERYKREVSAHKQIVAQMRQGRTLLTRYIRWPSNEQHTGEISLLGFNRVYEVTQALMVGRL